MAQTLAFRLGHALNGNTGHHRYHVGHILFRHRLAVVGLAGEPFLLHLVKLLLKRGLTVTESGGQLVVLALHGLVLLADGGGQLFFLGFYLGGNVGIAQVYTGAYFVHRVDGLVRKSAVGHIALRQSDTGHKGVVRIGHMVMVLIPLAQVLDDVEGLLGGARLYKHFLETALQGSVFLYAVAVLVERSGADALHQTAGQSGLQNVGGIHRAGSTAGAYHGVDLVDENDDVGVLLYLAQ